GATVTGGVSGVADFDGDGLPDLLAYTAADDPVVLFGRGDGTFRSADPYPVKTYSSPSGLGISGTPAAYDFDNDGRLDLALAVAPRNGDATFQAPFLLGPVTPYPPFPGQLSVSIESGDVDGDGLLDLFTRNGFLSQTPAPGVGTPTQQLILWRARLDGGFD